MDNKYKKIFKKAFNKNASVEDIFLLIYKTKGLVIDSWEEIEDLVEETFGERPDWNKFKKLERK